MRIVVIAHALKAGGGTSVGRNLIAALSQVGTGHSFLFIVPANTGYETVRLSGADHSMVYFRNGRGYWGRWLFDQIQLPRLVEDFKPDVVLGLGNRGLTKPPCAQAVLCQNAHLFYPRAHFGNETFLNALANGYKKWIFRRSLRSTALLLSQTPIAECRIKQTYGYEGKTTQLPNAISLDSLRGDQLSERPTALEEREHMLRLFCLTRYYPHKNLESIVDMFVRFREDLQDVLVVLTISADDHPNARKLLRTIDRHDLKANILNVGPLMQEELAAYYRHCHALFLPTLLESFTSTYLEAMQFGTPILTSDLDFARYICGEAAVYFNPWSVCEMKEMVVKFRDDPGLASLVAAKGKARIGHISPTWEDLARRACQAMQTIVARQGASSDSSHCPVAKGYA